MQRLRHHWRKLTEERIMDNNLFNRGPKKERTQLLLLSLTLGVVGGGLLLFTEKEIFAFIILGLALLAFLGLVAYPWIGRDVYLVFGLISLAVGHLVSWVVFRFVYLVGIVIFGLLMKLFGMDRLKKNFERGKKLATNFEDAPVSDIESFRRQS